MHNYGYCSTVGTTRYNAIRHAILRCAQKLTSQLIYRTRPKLESGKKTIQQTTISQACLLLNIEAGCRGGGYDVGVAIHVVRVMDGRSLAVHLVL